MRFDSHELGLNIEEFVRRVIEPAIRKTAARMIRPTPAKMRARRKRGSLSKD